MPTSAGTSHPARVLSPTQTLRSAVVCGRGLVTFRIFFGAMLAAWAFDELRTGRVETHYSRRNFHFTWWPFDFIRPLPDVWMNVLFGTLGLLALCVAAGLCYRVAALSLAAGFTYLFLIDRTNYQNHDYLLALLSWCLALMPLNRLWSLDVLLRRAERTIECPGWCLWLIRFHIGLPYVFGGLAKISPDWLAGEPMRTHLLQVNWPSSLAHAGHSEALVSLFVWGGLLFDLLIVPLLLWRRSRVAAFVVAACFHLTNAMLFNIHVFPWFMIGASTIFFDADWPARFIRSSPADISESDHATAAGHVPNWQIVLLSGWCVLHLLLPLRHFAIPGDANWTEEGHFFSWRMMLRTKDSLASFRVTDPLNGQTGLVPADRFLSAEQAARAFRDPDMILQFAQFLADEFERATGRRPQVRATVLCSLNGRRPSLLIDPAVNLASEPRVAWSRAWIMPLREPLRTPAWNIPMHNWPRAMQLSRSGLP